MENLIIIFYFIIGFILGFYWWDKYYEPQYNIVKESDEGVEEGMVILFIAGLIAFWPVVLIYRIITKIY